MEELDQTVKSPSQEAFAERARAVEKLGVVGRQLEARGFSIDPATGILRTPKETAEEREHLRVHGHGSTETATER